MPPAVWYYLILDTCSLLSTHYSLLPPGYFFNEYGVPLHPKIKMSHSPIPMLRDEYARALEGESLKAVKKYLRSAEDRRDPLPGWSKSMIQKGVAVNISRMTFYPPCVQERACVERLRENATYSNEVNC